jgi:hypothetical protein
MGKEWIANLAQEIKQKNKEAAESYGREQHKAGIVDAQGRAFFTSFVQCLEDNINDIKRQLQGDVTAAETAIQTINATTLKLSRSRFPWFDAHITHRNPSIVLDYAKGLGVAGDPALDRKSCHFVFHVADDDTLAVQEAFGDSPRQFQTPEELSRHITWLLFKV